MSKNKYKYLLGNTGLLTLSNFGSKILSFFLIPIYTNILTTSEYGMYDIYATTIALLIPILTLNIYEAIMIFSLDKRNNKNDIFNIGIKYTGISFFVIILAMLINKIFDIFSVLNSYWIYFIIIFIAEAMYTLLIKFCRGIEKVRESAVAGIINAISILLLNILCLCVFKMGLTGYFLATAISYLLSVVYLIFSIKAWKYLKRENIKRYETKMISYSFPLIFDTISWWIINASDRYIVTFMIGTAANGIYSMAYKIPSILNILQSIFNQAWTISAVKEYEEDSEKFYSNIYKFYNMAMVLTCSLLIVFDKVIAQVLFAKDFYIAWKYAPFLMVSVVFGALSGLLGGIFNAAKKSKTLSTTTVVGCLINIVLNIILVYKIGIVGAAISTLIAYVVVWLLRVIKVNKIKKIDINFKRDIISYTILIVQAVLMYFSEEINYVIIIQIILLVLVTIINIKEIKLLLTNFFNLINKKITKERIK